MQVQYPVLLSLGSGTILTGVCPNIYSTDDASITFSLLFRRPRRLRGGWQSSQSLWRDGLLGYGSDEVRVSGVWEGRTSSKGSSHG